MNLSERRLWSLWDMLKLDAASFYYAMSGLQFVRSMIETNNDSNLVRSPLSQIYRDGVSGRCAELRTQFEALQVQMTCMSLDRLIDNAVKPTFSYEDLACAVKDIDERLKDELELTSVYVLDDAKVKYFDAGQDLLGKEVASKFQSASFEIDEAGKCVALHRYTASVFHLMRVMEIGIRAFARCLKIPDPIKPAERNWGAILTDLKKGIDTRWPTTATRMHGDGALFESLYASLDAVKNPWRNATMHVENKYTGDEAISIMNAVESFMKRLAARMDEQGQPLA